MTNLIDDIKRDRALGTPGKWDTTGTHGRPTEFCVYAPAGRSVCSTGSYTDGLAATYFENCTNATRIARVPAMEAALLAAVELSRIIDKFNTTNMPGFRVHPRLIRAQGDFQAALEQGNE